MAKGIGLIGNFRGKVGNMVGYNLKDSNNKQTQGVRVYQPVVKNPKTAAQAEQRAKLLAVNATYRALKMVIDRGNETLPYGNKSRLAWLKNALKAETMPWFEKGAIVTAPVGCMISKGSIPSMDYLPKTDYTSISVAGVTSDTSVATIGEISTLLKGEFQQLKEGDQLTFVFIAATGDQLETSVVSFVIDSASSVAANTLFSEVAASENTISFADPVGSDAACVIISRLGDSGEHLRSTASIKFASGIATKAPYDADSKAAAIASYRASAAASGDWAEESIQ